MPKGRDSKKDRRNFSDLKHAWAGGSYHRAESDDSEGNSDEEPEHVQNAALTMRSANLYKLLVQCCAFRIRKLLYCLSFTVCLFQIYAQDTSCRPYKLKTSLF